MSPRLNASTLLVSTLIVSTFIGCAGDPAPAPSGDGGTSLAEQRTQGEFTGTWRRTLDDGGEYVFEVFDDGQTVRGEMTEGLPTDCLSYVFDLERGEDGLTGSSLVRFEEADDGLPSSYSTQWKQARLEDGAVVVEQQWIQTDEFGDVTEEGWSEVSYDFTPAVSEAERAAAWAAALAKVEAPHSITIGPEAGIGMGVVQLKGSKDDPTVWALMLVDETEDAWRVELTGGPLLTQEALAAAVMGLTVNKQSGHVTRAVVGLPGEVGAEVAISDETVPRREQLEGDAVELTIAAGTFAAEMVESRHGTSWVGTEGDTAGILLKWNGKDAQYELAEPVTAAEVTLANGEVVDATVATFTGDLTWTLTRHPIVRAFFPYDRGTAQGEWGFLAMEASIEESPTVWVEVIQEVIEVRDDASPQLDWPQAE